MKNLTVARKELKYYINYHTYTMLINKLSKIMSPDSHNSEKGYFIRSLYFDNLNNKAFHEKIAGIQERKKFRLRIYNFKKDFVKFEIKNRWNNYMLKETAIISKQDAIQIQNQNYEVLTKYNNPVLNKIYYHFKREKYYPIILIDYIREAYTFNMNNIRITFDKSLKCNVSNLKLFKDTAMTSCLNQDLIILEIKYDNFLPEYLKRVLQIPYFEKSAISKYCIGRLKHEGIN